MCNPASGLAKANERRELMDKEQFEQLMKSLKELNEYLENISSCLGGIDVSLDLIKDGVKQNKKVRK